MVGLELWNFHQSLNRVQSPMTVRTANRLLENTEIVSSEMNRTGSRKREMEQQRKEKKTTRTQTNKTMKNIAKTIVMKKRPLIESKSSRRLS
jgi:hypothetical protein